jgi:ADP-ribosylglycohydrolase
MRYRNDNMLLHIALGDAYAAGFEYIKFHPDEPEFKEIRAFQGYMQHPGHQGLRPGMYTDDTQMSIAVAETLINKGTSASYNDWVAAWFDTFKRDPRDGYSRGFQAILESVKSADELRATLRPNSTKNGAAMRAVPLGVIKDVDKLLTVAAFQATTTHASYEGVQSAMAIALMSHYALYDHRKLSAMQGWLEPRLPLFEKFRVPWEGPVQGNVKHSPYDVGINTAWAVNTLLIHKRSLREIMDQVIEWGGDTDSVAAIAWGIAGARHQDEVLPEFLVHDLEAKGNLKYGVPFLQDLGKRLMELKI